jgi:hypothetical protein
MPESLDAGLPDSLAADALGRSARQIVDDLFLKTFLNDVARGLSRPESRDRDFGIFCHDALIIIRQFRPVGLDGHAMITVAAIVI